MYYLINNDSDVSFSQQLATTDTYLRLSVAKKAAERCKDRTGNNYSIIKLESVWTTQTLHEALLEATDVPYMARPGDYASQFAEEAGISYESALSQLNID